jgi:SAM-dependent methyltransferase
VLPARVDINPNDIDICNGAAPGTDFAARKKIDMKKFYENHILPGLVHHVCAHEKFSPERGKIVPRATGVVVELGIGSGLNLPFYDHEKIKAVIGVDPSSRLAERAAERVRAAPFDVELLAISAEELPLEDNSADTVLTTFSLCTIPDLAAAFSEARRVLKPGGQLLFCEHGLADEARIAKWQNRLNPFWMPFSGGCHLNRDIPALIRDSGFEITGMESGFMDGAPGIGGFLYRGAAKAR